MDGDDEVCRPRYMNDCSQAYMNFFCFLNFPRCDEYDQSLILCNSVYENCFRSCGYSKDMWRCGPSEFLNGEYAEVPTKDEKQERIRYSLAHSFQAHSERMSLLKMMMRPLVVCTPSLPNGATGLLKWGRSGAATAALPILGVIGAR